jgi:hypothetical protein
MNGDDLIRFTIGSNILFVNNEIIYMDTPAEIRTGGFAYLPVAYLASALGVQYEWVEYNEFNRGAIFYRYQ